MTSGTFFASRSSSSRLFLPVTHFMFSLQNNIFVQTAKVFQIPCVIQDVSWHENTKSYHVCTTFANPSSVLAHCSQSRCSLFSTRSIIRCHPLCSPVICSSQFSSHLCTQACLHVIPGSFTRKCVRCFKTMVTRDHGTNNVGKTNKLFSPLENELALAAL